MRREASTRLTGAGWPVTVRVAAALAAAMGVGRFVFTPVLPLMEQQAQLLPAEAGVLATSNYLGYLLGALGGIAWPWLSRARSAGHAGGLLLVVSLAAMPLTQDLTAWAVLRGVAGVASAVVFMVAGTAILTGLADSSPHLVGWAYGGVGAGIALSGGLVAVVGQIGDWRAAWVSAAVLAALLLWLARDVGQPPGAAARPVMGAEAVDVGASALDRRRFGALAVSYFLEGAGYIIAGTFLVAAVAATGPAWLSGSVWTVVGLSAVPSCAAWLWASRTVSRPTLITGALLLQAAGIALPALSSAAPAALVAAVVFGGTFVGITTLSLSTGRSLRVPRAVAVLTAGYGVGQVLGPLVVAPTLDGGYRLALLVGAGLVLLAALAAALVRLGPPDLRP